MQYFLFFHVVSGCRLSVPVSDSRILQPASDCSILSLPVLHDQLYPIINRHFVLFEICFLKVVRQRNGYKIMICSKMLSVKQGEQ